MKVCWGWVQLCFAVVGCWGKQRCSEHPHVLGCAGPAAQLPAGEWSWHWWTLTHVCLIRHGNGCEPWELTLTLLHCMVYPVPNGSEEELASYMLILNACQIPPFLISPFFTILLKQTASNSWALYDKVVISADNQQQIYWPLRCIETIFSLIWQAGYFIKTVFQQFWITAATPFCQSKLKTFSTRDKGIENRAALSPEMESINPVVLRMEAKKKKAGFQTVMINFLIIELESEGVFLAEKLTNMWNCWYSTFSEHPNMSGPHVLKTGSNLDELEDFSVAKA